VLFLGRAIYLVQANNSGSQYLRIEFPCNQREVLAWSEGGLFLSGHIKPNKCYRFELIDPDLAYAWYIYNILEVS
jgi:hypothetical protein